MPGIDLLTTASDYDGWIKDALILFKSGRKQNVSGLGEVLGKLISSFNSCEITKLAIIPTSRKKYGERGYNTLEMLVSAAIRDDAKPKPELLTFQVRQGIQEQVGLNFRQRQQNLERAFLSNSVISGDVVLVDDVVTTGATLRAAASALRSAGAKRVYALAICGSAQWR